MTAVLGIVVVLWCLHIPTWLDTLWPWPPLAHGSLAGRIVVVWAAILQPVTAYLAMIVLTVVLARCRWRDLAGSLLASIVLTVSLVTVAKAMVGRARPDTPWLGNLHADASFPSGHSAAGFALAIAVVQATWALTRRPRPTVVAGGLAAMGAVAVGVGRLLLDVHHVSDVLGGGVIAGFAACLAAVLTGAWRGTGTTTRAAGGAVSARSIAVVYHPHRVRGLTGLRRRLASAARRNGDGEPVWHATAQDGDGRTQANAAIDGGADLVISLGGDGTLHQVLEAVAGRTDVALLPAGSGNVLAQNLGVPLDMGRAIDLALQGHARALDLMRVDVRGTAERAVVGAAMAGAGADAAVLTDTRERAKRIGGPLAYLLAGTRHVRASSVGLHIIVDGVEWAGGASLVSVGNVGSLHPGITLMGSADPADGRLEVLVASPRGTGDVVAMMAGVLLGRSSLRRVKRFSGREVSMSFDEPVPFQVDGDVVGPVTSARVVVLPGAASVVRG